MSALERTGWRDQALSERHRLYGFDCPMVDLDFVVIEYDRALPYALCEYKHLAAAEVNLRDANYRALSELADRARIPFFVVRYNPSRWTYQVTPVNAFATAVLFDEATFSEQEYAAFLYRIRGRRPDTAILARLNDVKPEGGCL